MNEPLDPIESELAALRPREVSPELRSRVAGRLGNSVTRWPWGIAVVAGLAACLAAFFLGPGIGPGVATRPGVEPARPPELATRARLYRPALVRSPEDLDALLDQETLRAPRSSSDVSLVQIRAFTRPDLTFIQLTGEL